MLQEEGVDAVQFYTESEGFISPEQIKIFRSMRSMLENTLVPNSWGEVILSCHHICHALGKIFPQATICDGHFGKGEQHGWLEFEPSTKAQQADPRARIIADMYPIAGVSSFLLFTFFMTTWAKLYTPDPAVLETVKQNDPYFNEHVSELTQIFSKAAIL